MPRFFSLLLHSPLQPPPAQPISDADATYPNCYTEWRNDHYGLPRHGFTRVLQLLLVASVVLLLLAAVVAVTLASFAVGTGVIRLSTLGETAESAGTLRSILHGEYWG